MNREIDSKEMCILSCVYMNIFIARNKTRGSFLRKKSQHGPRGIRTFVN